MVIPDWAERAIEQFKPQNSGGCDSQYSEIFQAWQAIANRFRARWRELGADAWKVPDRILTDTQLRRNYKHSPVDFAKQCILECAVEIATEVSLSKSPAKSKEAAIVLTALNAKISGMTKELATIFRQRQLLMDDYSIYDVDPDIDNSAPDPMRFFDAFKLAANRPEFCDWRYVANKEIHEFFRVAVTPRRKPNWSDVLEEVANLPIRKVASRDAGLKATLRSTTNSTNWSPWILALIARLEDWELGGLEDGFLLECLTNSNLADLACVALDVSADDLTINGEAIRKLKSRYFARKIKADD